MKSFYSAIFAISLLTSTAFAGGGGDGGIPFACRRGDEIVSFHSCKAGQPTITNPELLSQLLPIDRRIGLFLMNGNYYSTSGCNGTAVFGQISGPGLQHALRADAYDGAGTAVSYDLSTSANPSEPMPKPSSLIFSMKRSKLEIIAQYYTVGNNGGLIGHEEKLAEAKCE